jgi:hypothetical protein
MTGEIGGASVLYTATNGARYEIDAIPDPNGDRFTYEYHAPDGANVRRGGYPFATGLESIDAAIDSIESEREIGAIE